MEEAAEGAGKRKSDHHGIDAEIKATLFGTQRGQGSLWSVPVIVESVGGRWKRPAMAQVCGGSSHVFSNSAQWHVLVVTFIFVQ